MTIELSDYVAVLRREVTPPGSELFANVSDASMTGHLTDSFWEARLDGFLDGYVADEDGAVTPDLPRELIALVVLYAGIRIIRNRLINMNTSFRAQAGPVEYEVQNSASVLSEMLRQLATTKKRLQTVADDYGITPTCLIDGYTVRQVSGGSYGGFVGSLLAESFS